MHQVELKQNKCTDSREMGQEQQQKMLRKDEERSGVYGTCP